MGILLTGAGTTVSNGVNFRPSRAPGLVADWDFSDRTKLYTDSGTTLVSADGDVVGQINDGSGNGYHLRQTDGTKKGLYKVNIANGKPGVLFDGVNDNYASIASAATFQFLHQSANTVYIVVKNGLVADPNLFFALIDNITLAGSVGTRFGTRIAWDDRASSSVNETIRNTRQNGATPSVSAVTANAFCPANTFVVLSVITDPGNATAANRSYVRKNGGTASQTNAATTVVGTTAPTYALTIGATAGDAGFPFSGYKLRVLVYNQAHGTTDRQYVENGLIARYAIT